MILPYYSNFQEDQQSIVNKKKYKKDLINSAFCAPIVCGTVTHDNYRNFPPLIIPSPFTFTVIFPQL